MNIKFLFEKEKEEVMLFHHLYIPREIKYFLSFLNENQNR